MNITAKDLRKAAKIVEKVVSLQKQFEQLLNSTPTCKPRKAKRRMSRAGRKAIAMAAKRRWKAARAAGKSTL